MRIQYFGHSCFRIISEAGTAIVCDPYKESSVGFALPKISCEVVTISHHHADHDAVDQLKGCPALLEGDVRIAADDVAIQSIKTWHDDMNGKLRGENFVFCFLVDGLKVVHLGDIGEQNDLLVEQIRECDVLLVPVGGVYTIGPRTAKWYVDQVNPKIVIPMHYSQPDLAFKLGTLDEFLKQFDQRQVTFAHSETLRLDDQPENSRPQIVVLERFND